MDVYLEFYFLFFILTPVLVSLKSYVCPCLRIYIMNSCKEKFSDF